MASFNTTARQITRMSQRKMTEMFQRKKKQVWGSEWLSEKELFTRSSTSSRSLTHSCRPQQGCATRQHRRAKCNYIGLRATVTCVKLCGLGNLLATHGRLARPFKNLNACMWGSGSQNFSSRANFRPRATG